MEALDFGVNVLQTQRRYVRFAIVDRRVVAQRVVLVEPGRRARRLERAILFVAAVKRERSHAGPAHGQVATESLAFEVVAVVLPTEQERKAVLEIADLLELDVIGAEVHRGSERHAIALLQRLLDLNAVKP